MIGGYHGRAAGPDWGLAHEMLIVLVIISVLVGVALLSWRAYQDQATEEAMLQRLDIAQRDFMLRHGRYATEIERQI